MRRMEMRSYFTFTITTRRGSAKRLDRAIFDLRHAFKRLNQLNPMRKTLSLVGGLEVRLTADKKLWQPHIHVVVDTTGVNIDIDELDDQWRKLTGKRGTFTIPDIRWRRTVGGQNIELLAQYIFKAHSFFPQNTLCPLPGSLALDDLSDLLKATKGHQVFMHHARRFGKQL